MTVMRILCFWLCLFSSPWVYAEPNESSVESQASDEEESDVMTDAERAALVKRLHASPSRADNRLAGLIESVENPFSLTPYEQNYIVYTYSSHENKAPYQALNSTALGEDFSDGDLLEKHEVKFKLSLMFPIARGVLGRESVLMASYTQLSMWQALNSRISAPFRETNYEPQIFVAWFYDHEILGMTFRGMELGFNHQSNGRGEGLSRSWNRLFANFLLQRGDFRLSIKPYIRLQESIEEDDNPNIEDYLGNYRMELAYRHGGQVFSLATRNSFDTGKGSAEFGWSLPITERVRFYTQVFTGYGETLIDYNFKQTRIGMGFMLNDLL